MKHRQLVALVVVALGVVAGRAATAQIPPAGLNIVGEAKAKAGALVRLQVKGQLEGAALRWRVSPAAGVDRADTDPTLLQFVAPPGTYQVEVLALAVVDGKPVLDAAERTVVIGAGAPITPPKPAATRDAIGRTRFDGSGCSATIIGPRRPDGRWDVLTAAHCLSGRGQTGSMLLRDGRTLAVIATVVDHAGDVGWLVTTDATLDSLPYALLAATAPAPGTEVAHDGYGYDKPGNHETGRVGNWTYTNGLVGADLNVSNGDSGGGVYRTDTGEIVGSVYGTQHSATYTRVTLSGAVRAASLRPRGPLAAIPEWEPAPIPQLSPVPAPEPAHP